MENSFLLHNEEEKNNYSSRNSFPVKGIIIFFISIVFLFLFCYFFLISAPSDFPKGTIVNIQKGSNLLNISEDLKSKNIIRSKVFFEAFVVVYGGENHISEGDYLFEEKVPVYEVARRIVKRDRHLAPLKITIPEGFDNNEISDTYKAYLKNFNKDKFLINAKEKQGYLFPDTYFFFTTDNEENVLKYMSENFDKKIKSLEKEIRLSGKAEKDIIVMASLIEREAKGDGDRGIISGILWNRLSKKMPLQVDAAPATYKERGLPEVPICNPGLEAIKAAINPIKSHYLYYLHDKNGLIHYAVTFTEHRKNIIKYLK